MLLTLSSTQTSSGQCCALPEAGRVAMWRPMVGSGGRANLLSHCLPFLPTSYCIAARTNVVSVFVVGLIANSSSFHQFCFSPLCSCQM
jgi:hypothetical protein